MNSTSSKAERTRNFIIEATAGLFNKKGYAGTSISDLTAATGLTKGSIYGNFENKEEVAVAAFDYNFGRIAAIITSEIESATTAREKLLVYAKIYREVISDVANNGGCPILNTAIDADDTNTALKGRAAGAIDGWVKNVSGIIRKGIRDGEFRKDIDVKRVALSMVALIEGGVMIACVSNNPGSLDIALQTVELMITEMRA